MKNKTLTTVFSIFFFSNLLLSQQGTVGAGGNINSPTGSVSFSVGQVSDRTISNSNYIISEGIQQAYEIYTLSTSELTFKFDVKIFPNPTADILKVSFSNESKQETEFQIYDLNGSMLLNEHTSNENIDLNMSNFAPGSYLLKLYSSNQIINSYKIIKN
ncbi:MAG: T9SS type A sorting domain-containing protein [Flavobacteriales bacterium]|nr:T9SS type A sorting domain-containing protein [Flavobacteriales bacterium]